MSAIPVTINDVQITHADGTVETGATVTGSMVATGLVVDNEPPAPGGPPGQPTFPIWGPPGMELPDVPGYPPVVGGGPIIPPDQPIPPSPPLWIPAFIPGFGWIAIPGFPHPTPSKRK